MGPNDLLYLPTRPDSRLKEEVACDRSGGGTPAAIASGSGD